MSLLAPQAESLNAKVGALALGGAALLTLVLSHATLPLAPLRLLTLALAAFAAWAFCDEMGLKKPLNRGGFVFFAIAAVAKIQLVMGLSTSFVGRYYLLYAAFLMLALLFWSVAFLHRPRTLKLVGAVGVAASLLPIAAVVVGHLVVGMGALLGVDALLSATGGTAPADLRFVTLVERMFGLWGYLAAWLLWRGHIKDAGPQKGPEGPQTS